MTQYKIVVSDDRYNGAYDEEKEVLKDLNVEFIVNQSANCEGVIMACKDADGILCNLAPMGDDVISQLEKCKIISRYGVGYDNVAVEACTNKGICVANVADFCAEEVSSQALGLLLACARKIARRDVQVRKGMWNICRDDPIYRIAGKTFVFLGFGIIARCLHRKIQGFNFKEILIFDPFIDDAIVTQCGCRKVDWNEALSQGDFISIHMPVNDQTRGIINRDAFAKMKSTTILVNTSRGPIIDELSLIDALNSGQINSAGLDVHNQEPLDKESPLMHIENCVLSDHVGWYSEEAMSELKTKAAKNVREVLNGRAPLYPVNTI